MAGFSHSRPSCHYKDRCRLVDDAMIASMKESELRAHLEELGLPKKEEAGQTRAVEMAKEEPPKKKPKKERDDKKKKKEEEEQQKGKERLEKEKLKADLQDKSSIILYCYLFEETFRMISNKAAEKQAV